MKIQYGDAYYGLVCMIDSMDKMIVSIPVLANEKAYFDAKEAIKASSSSHNEGEEETQLLVDALKSLVYGWGQLVGILPILAFDPAYMKASDILFKQNEH